MNPISSILPVIAVTVMVALPFNGRAEVIPPRAQDQVKGVNILSDEELFSKIQESNLEAIVGLKSPGAVRGIWRNKILISREEQRTLEGRLRTFRDTEILRADDERPWLVAKIGSLETLRRLRGLPFIDYVEPRRMHVIGMSGGSGGCNNWPANWNGDRRPISSVEADVLPYTYDYVKVPQTWNRGTGRSIKVGITDTGVSPNQGQLTMEPGFGGRFPIVCKGMTCITSARGAELAAIDAYASYSRDDCGHGTRVAGTVAAPRDGRNIVGVAYESDLVSVKFTDGVAFVPADYAIDALQLARARGAKVQAMAWGNLQFNEESNALADEIRAQAADGVLFIGAAGTSPSCLNDTGYVVFPAKLSEVIAVTGLDMQTLDVECHNHYGPELDLSVYISQFATGPAYDFDLSDEMVEFSGTSNATAIAAGIAALVWSVNPSLTADDVRSRLLAAGANFPVHSDRYGFGVLNAYRASGGFESLSISGPTDVQPSATYTLTGEPKGDGPFEFYWYTDACSAACLSDPTCAAGCPRIGSCIDSRCASVNIVAPGPDSSLTVKLLTLDKIEGKRLVSQHTVRTGPCVPRTTCSAECGSESNGCGGSIQCGSCAIGEVCKSGFCYPKY